MKSERLNSTSCDSFNVPHLNAKLGLI